MKWIHFIHFDLIQYSRNRWLIGFSLLFGFIASSYLITGADFQEYYDGFNRAMIHLLNVNLYLMPLIVLLLGSIHNANEKESGWMSLVLTYPISPLVLLFARVSSLNLVLTAVLSLGYGLASLAASLFAATLPINDFLILYGLSVGLIILLSPLAICIGILSKTRFQAISMALASWTLLVLLYDFLIIFLIRSIPPHLFEWGLTLVVALNPIQLVRVLVIMIMDGGVVFGPSLYQFTAFVQSASGYILIIGCMFVWIGLPVLIGYFHLRRRR